MKKLFFSILSVLVLLLSVMTANALTLGDKDTRVSILSEDILEEIQGTFTIDSIDQDGTMTCTVTPESKYLNTNTRSEKNINITFPGTQGTDPQTFTYAVASGTTSLTVSVKGRIPENLDAVDNTLDESSFKVATISCSLGTFSYTEELFMQRENQFEIDEIEAEFNGDIETLNEDGDEITDLEPGQTVALDVIMDNNFDEDDDVDMEVDVTISCDPDDIDIDDDSDDVDITAEDSDSITFDLDLDEDDVEDKKYKCTIQATATDDYGAIHGEEWEIELDIEKEKYEVEIKQLSLSPDAITCDDREVTASIRIKNVGKKNDDEVKLELVATELDIIRSITDIDLDESDSTRKVMTFVVPDDADAGTYKVTAKTYNLGISLSDQQSVDLVVPNCKPEPEPTPVPPRPTPTPRPQEDTQTDSPDVVVTTPDQSPEPVTPEEEEEEEPVEEEADDDEAGIPSLYVVLLVILIVVLLAGVIGLMVYLLRPAN